MKLSSRIALGSAVIGLAAQAVFATSYTNTIAQMTAYITSNMAAQHLQGISIALVDDQTVVWTNGFGMADRERGVPADADTVYHIGSCSKAFTATAALQLWDQGHLNLEAPLTNYIAEFSMLPRFIGAQPVTIRSLLNHHCGLPGDFFNGAFNTRTHEELTAWLIAYLQGDYPIMPVDQSY